SGPNRIASAWKWVRSHWIDILLPPAILLLGAGVTRYVLWVHAGHRYMDAQRHYDAALAAQKNKDYAASNRELAFASKIAPDDANAHLRIASAYHSMREPLQAAREQERALRLSPPKEAAYVQLLATYCRLGQFDDAGRVLTKEVLPRWPASSDTAYYEGIVHF